MTTYSALAILDDGLAAAALGDALEALSPSGVGVFEIEDGSGRWEVGAYFVERPDETALALLSAAYAAAPFVVSEIPDQDWVAQVRRELTPVRAGRFVVHGGHDRETIPVNAIGLEIEAAMAFGTGHHGTTEGCLLALDRLYKSGWRAERVADVGCGTGVLAMAAARRGARRVVATDIDPIAAATAAANCAANGVHHRIAVGCAPGARHPRLRALRPVDLLFANILARPLKRLAPEITAATRPGGVVVLSGMLSRQGRDVSRIYRAWGHAPLSTIEQRGWVTLVLRRAHEKSRP